MNRKDKVVQSTDGDALSSKYSAVKKGYLKDRFVDLFVEGAKLAAGKQGPGSARKAAAQFQPKLPLINRGTFVRHYAIDLLVERFLNEHKQPDQRVQIISLGAGSDTRPFSLWSSNEKYKSKILYHELDFGVSVQRKRDIILHDDYLRGIIGEMKEDGNETEIHTERYHLHGIDLRTVDSDFVLPGSDSSLPTLVISECCLCYLEPDETKKVILWITANFKTSSIVMYEPLSGQDQFGQVMIENLASRGISIPSMTKFPSLQSQIDRFHTAGYKQVIATSMDIIHDEWLSTEEQQRIHGLEFLDEREELLLLLKHYCVVWATDLQSI